jgi:hypothetical protein
MGVEPTDTSGDIRRLALEKMSAVLGRAQAERLLAQITSGLQMELHTADDLHAFAAELTKRGGFEGAVGAMLGVRAVMLGARGK